MFSGLVMSQAWEEQRLRGQQLSTTTGAGSRGWTSQFQNTEDIGPSSSTTVIPTSNSATSMNSITSLLYSL